MVAVRKFPLDFDLTGINNKL